MNRGILYLCYLFVLLFLVGSVSAIDVSLDSPSSGKTILSNEDQEFKCYINELSNAVNMTLTLTGCSYSIVKYDTELTTYYGSKIADFTVTEFVPCTYTWTCTARDANNQIYTSPESRSLIVTETNTVPEIYPAISSQTGGSGLWTLNLSSNKHDYETPNSLTWSVPYIDYAFCNVVISGDVATFYPVSGASGSKQYTFVLTDPGGLSDKQNITVSLNQASTPSLSCTGTTITWYKDNTKSVSLNDFCDPDADSYTVLEYPAKVNLSLSSGTANFIPNSSWTGTQTSKFRAVKSGYNEANFTLTLTVQEQSSSNNDEDTSNEEEEETAEPVSVVEKGLFTIKSHIPNDEKISMKAGDSKKFELTPSGDTNVKWFLDEKEIGNGNSYTFKADEEGIYELTGVIGDVATLKENDDIYTWTIRVGSGGAAVAGTLCGNNKTDTGENCENCAKDVRCAEGENCISKECVKSTGFFSKVTGFAVDTKDFVVEKWEYSLGVGGVIVVLIVAGLVAAGRRRKKDVLYGFGKEGFFSKIGKVFRGKKTFVKPNSAVVEKKTEVFIDKSSFENKEK